MRVILRMFSWFINIGRMRGRRFENVNLRGDKIITAFSLSHFLQGEGPGRGFGEVLFWYSTCTLGSAWQARTLTECPTARPLPSSGSLYRKFGNNKRGLALLWVLNLLREPSIPHRDLCRQCNIRALHVWRWLWALLSFSAAGWRHPHLSC